MHVTISKVGLVHERFPLPSASRRTVDQSNIVSLVITEQTKNCSSVTACSTSLSLYCNVDELETSNI